MTTKKTHSHTLNPDNQAIVKASVNRAISQALKDLESKGIDVPGFNVQFQDNTKTVFKPSKCFTKLNHDYISKLEDKYGLTMTEKGIILTLTGYIGYQCNLLCLPSGDAIKRKDLEHILGISHNVIDSNLKSLVEKGVLCKGQVSRQVYYLLNPYIAYRGIYIDKTFLKIFKHTEM